MKTNRRDFIKGTLAGIFGSFLTWAGLVRAEETEPTIDTGWHHIDCWWDENGHTHGRDAFLFADLHWSTDEEKRAAFYCHLADLADRNISYRLVFNQTRNRDHIDQIVGINPDLVTCQIVRFDEWDVAWIHEHNGHPIFKAVRYESEEAPSIMRLSPYARKRETDLDWAMLDVAYSILNQAAKAASWIPANKQISFVVPLWVMEVIFILPERGDNETQPA